MLAEERGSIRYDYILIAAVVTLTLLGLVILYSASYLFAINQPDRFRNGWTPLGRNLTVCGVMIVIFPILALTNLERLKKEWVMLFILILTVGLNLLPLLQQTPNRTMAMRWIDFGFTSFQPSEMIKVVLPLYLAYILEKNEDRLNSFAYGPLPPVVVTTIFCALMLAQSNFSEAIFIAVTSLAICFIAGIHLRWFGLALAVLSILGYILTFGDKEGRWYHRISSFSERLIYGNTVSDGLKQQIEFSVEAVRAGGFWGKGIGQGTLKVRVPEVHGDFVFASFVEETGFLGVLLYFTLFGVFCFICYMVAWRSRDRFSQLLAFGLITPIAMQTLVNIAVVADAVPTTGVPLPFVSSGGSSLLMTLVSAALLVNITRRRILSLGTRSRYAG